MGETRIAGSVLNDHPYFDLILPQQEADDERKSREPGLRDKAKENVEDDNTDFHQMLQEHARTPQTLFHLIDERDSINPLVAKREEDDT